MAKKMALKGKKKTNGFTDDNKKWLHVKQDEVADVVAEDVADDDVDTDDEFEVAST